MPERSEQQTAAPRTRRGRGRRPADEVRADVLGAAGALLLDEGMGAFTIEAVAERAGVSKTTIYKWWPSKGALALDGYFHAVESALAFPDSGDLEADLTAQLRSFVHVLTETPAGRVIAELIGQAQTDPDLAATLLQRYSGPRRDLAVARMRGAQDRGTCAPTSIPRSSWTSSGAPATTGCSCPTCPSPRSSRRAWSPT